MIPTTYDEVASGWTPFIAKMIRGTHLVPADEIDDVKQDILLDLVARDALSYFDPKIASWPTFLRNFTVRRCWRYRKHANRWFQASLTLDAPVRTNDDDDSGTTTYGDLTGKVEYVIAEWILSHSELASFQLLLERVYPTPILPLPQLDHEDPLVPNPEDGWDEDCPLTLAVFNKLVKLVLAHAADEDYNRTAIANSLGIKKHDVNAAIVRVRALGRKSGLLT